MYFKIVVIEMWVQYIGGIVKQTKCSSVEPGFPKLVGIELNLLKTNPATENIHSRLKRDLFYVMDYLVLLMDLLY